jgi:hypothetical protein
MRKIAYSAFALLLASLMLAVPSPSNAVTPPPPGAPPALNVLPSTIIGATSSLAGAGRLEVQMAYLYKFAQTPGFWQALAAHQAGTATPAQTASVTSTTGQFRIPATKLGALARSAGGALTVVSGYQFGTAIGGGILDVIGFDRTGAVCSQTSGVVQTMVGILTGVDCEQWNEFAEDFEANAGLEPGFSSGTVCATAGTYAGACMTITGRSQKIYPPGGPAQIHDRYCVYTTAGGPTAISMRLQFTDGSISNAQVYWTAPPGNTVVAEGLTYCGTQVLTTNQKPPISGFGWQSSADPSLTLAPAAELSTNPTRTLKCVVLGDDGITYTKVGEPYTEDEGVLPAPSCPDLPPGVDAVTITVYETVGGEDTQLWQESTTPEYQEHQSSYPECAGGTCMLDLRTVAGVSCFQTPTECANWFSDPNKADKFNCWYGTHAVDLAECNVYGPSFKPDAQTNGTPLGDPENGTQTDAPPGANPGADKDTFGQPVQDPASERQCFPEGWGVLNPVEWVTKPVQCALQWAFVPRQSKVDTFTARVNTLYSNSPPGKVAIAVSTFAFPVIAEGGCSGITVDMGWLERDGIVGDFPELHLASACPGEPLHPFAVFTNLALTVACAVLAFKVWPGLVGRIFNYGGVTD